MTAAGTTARTIGGRDRVLQADRTAEQVVAAAQGAGTRDIRQLATICVISVEMGAAIRIDEASELSQIVVGRRGGDAGGTLPALGSQVLDRHRDRLVQRVVLGILVNADVGVGIRAT